MNRHHTKIYIGFAIALLFGWLGYYFSELSASGDATITDAELALHRQERIAENHLKILSNDLKNQNFHTVFEKNKAVLSNLYKQHCIALYVYKQDTLCFWTDNQPAIDLEVKPREQRIELLKIRNGWYESILQTTNLPNGFTLRALIKIKTEYDFENRYLKNQFSEWFKLPSDAQLIVPARHMSNTVKSKNGNTLFEIGNLAALHINDKLNNLSCLCYLICYVCLLIAFYLWLRVKIKQTLYFNLTFALLCFASRTLMIYFKIPESFYHHSLYNAQLFANASSFYFSYLGDVLINSIMLFFVVILYFKTVKNYELHTVPSRSVVIVIYGLLLIFFSNQIRSLIHSLIYNSTISYNIYDLFHVNIHSVIGFFAIGLWLFAFYRLIEQVTCIYERNLKHYIMFCFILLVVFGCMYQFDSVKEKEFIDYVWPIPLMLISFILKVKNISRHFIGIGTVILINVFAISSLFQKYESLNKKQTFEALALNLSDTRDIIAENELNKICISIKENPILKKLFSSGISNSSQIEQLIRQQNFSGYFERYDIVLSLFKDDCTPLFVNLNPMYLNEDYFLHQIEKYGQSTLCKDLYFIDKEKKSMRYVAKINIEESQYSNKIYHLFIQMEPKLAVNLGAFPDLLLDKSLEKKIESRQISYAVYEFDKLLQNFGEYQYPLFVQNGFSDFFVNDAYRHFIYHPQKDKTVIITDTLYGLWEKFTFNSYLFIFFSLFVLMAVWIDALLIKRKHQFASLNYRIQFILVSVVIISLTIAVIGTIWVVNNQFEFKNEKELILKSQVVLKELEQTVGEQETLNPFYKEIIAYKLKHLAQLFGSDISLFNKQGTLYASSQPAVYSLGLLSNLMHPIAYQNFIKTTRSSFVHKEQIGELIYLSAYVPFYSKKGKLLGYLNLPYFSRQKDLEKELTAYLTTLINIYAILISVVSVVALLVSDILTKPLRIIKQQLSNIQFGKFNEALHWQSDDEIGKLVAEYNNMLIKLDKSSQLLAQSERESAWREMAKQVAHEIKNPLTPMKLNVQHLQRVVETHPDDINERVKKVSLMLIEQIDTLSHIATEFSNFAKFPNPVLEKVNLSNVIHNVAGLFQQGMHCEVMLHVQEHLLIMADREQCLRIFTNLLKNAEQSIPKNRKGQINITAYSLNKTITVTIQDNGNGISDDIKNKLFTPYFTTKSSGTGLGLAMVKSAVVSFNGSISFNTEVGKGTSFTLVFPEYIS